MIDAGFFASPAWRVRRVISECRFSVQLNHFIPGFRSYSVAVFLKRQSDITLRRACFPQNKALTGKVLSYFNHIICLNL